MLHEHENLGRIKSTSVAADAENIDQRITTFIHLITDINKERHVVKIAGSLDVVTTKTAKRFVGIAISAFLDIPTRGFGNENTWAQTKIGAITVEPIMVLQATLSLMFPRGTKITSTMKPSIIPNAVHICHIITRAPRIGAGRIQLRKREQL